VYSANSLDLTSLFDFYCESYGGWCYKILRVKEAQNKATGKNVTVALLDHSFNKNHPALKNRIVSHHSCIEAVPALSEESDHGTSIAISLVNVAPGVNIMPVVIYGNGSWGKLKNT
jgi:subtilisin family serine protease